MNRMSMKFFALLLVLCFTGKVEADELLLGAAGRSGYQIIIPEKYPAENLAASVQAAAELMKESFAEQGIALELYPESKADAKKPGIYLGKTDFAIKNGIDFDKMEGWTYTFKAVGMNLIVAGNDQPDPMPIEMRSKRVALQGGVPLVGTLKATTEFVYKYLGVRFLYPGQIEYMQTPIIYVPSDLDVTKRPFAREVEVLKSRDIYFIANGFEPMPTALSHGGHYHQTAITQEEYGKTHPEYFVYGGGIRNPSRGHLCFSNPEVRELIYKKLLEDCDKGYDIIELGQIDGFVACQCEKCHDLYGIKPTGPINWKTSRVSGPFGEKLWIMHRDMALRLKKDRPSKKVMVSAYSVSKNPPTTIKEFPDNMMVELMNPVDRLKEWPGGVNVPAGYAGYLYVWSANNGYVPIRSAAYMKELVDTLVTNDIRIIQNNGKSYKWGIEGINIYAYHRMLNDPYSKTIDELNDEYIEAAYKEASVPMKVFYRKLHQRLNFMPEASVYASQNGNQLLKYAALYSADLMNELESKLVEAEKMVTSENAAIRLETTRYEFDYLKHVVDTMYVYQVFLRHKNEQTLDAVLSEVKARNDHINQYSKRDRPAFPFISAESLITNHGGLDIEPYNWNLATINKDEILNTKTENKRLVVKRASKALSLDSAEWKDVSVNELGKERGAKENLVEKTTFQVLYDNKNLYVRFEAGLPAKLMDTYSVRGRDQEIWLQECMIINLATAGDKSRYYYLNFEPVANSYTDANHGFITDVLHPKFGWNDNTWDGDWTYENKLDQETNKWIAFVTLPYATFNSPVPKKGDMWYANFGRIHFKDDTGGTSQPGREKSVWVEKNNVSKNPGEGFFGEMVFE